MSDFTFDITDSTDTEFYTGVGTAADVPGDYDIAINGRGYMADKAHPAFGGESAYLGRMGISAIPLIRNQADASTEPGEATVNPEDLWPRSQHSWHKGAGQQYLDAADSDRSRFWQSQGVDCWTRGQLKLLHSTELLTTSTTVFAVLYGWGGLYGFDVYPSPDLYFMAATDGTGTWSATNVATHDGTITEVTDVAWDGGRNHYAVTNVGIEVYDAVATTWSHYGDPPAGGSYTHVWFVKGRLLATGYEAGATAQSLYNITTTGAAPSPLMTLPAEKTFTGIAGGHEHIFFADAFTIYRTEVRPDGTALAVPTVAAAVPDGESINCLYDYLGFIFIGEHQGFRVGQADSAGSLTLGALVETGSVRAFGGAYGPHVYFEWSLDGHTVARLGRMDLTQFRDDGSPAYASDVYAQSVHGGADLSGRIGFIANVDGQIVFSTTAGTFGTNSGASGPTEAFLTTGWIEFGQISYGMTDDKIALRTSMKHQPLTTGESVTVSVSPDNGAYVFIGTSDTVGSTSPDGSMKVPEVTAQHFQVKMTLANQVVLESYDFRAYPCSARGQSVLMPILLHEFVETASGRKQAVDVLAEYNYLKSLEGSRNLISYQELGQSSSALLEEAAFQRQQAAHDRSFWNGTLVLKLKVLGD